jgi:hypothetical protein
VTGVGSQEAVTTPNAVQVITPASIASAEAVGTSQLNQEIVVTGIATAESVQGPGVAQLISVSSIGTAEALGSVQLDLTYTIATSSIFDDGYGTAQLNLEVTPSGLGTEEVVTTPGVTSRITPDSVASGEAHGALTLAYIIAPAGFGEAVVGTAQLNQFIAAVGGIASEEAVTAPLMVSKIAVAAVSSGEAVGVTQLTQNIHVESIAEVTAIGQPTMEGLIAPAGIAPGDMGTAKVVSIISPASVASAEAVPSAITVHQTLHAVGISVPQDVLVVHAPGIFTKNNIAVPGFESSFVGPHTQLRLTIAPTGAVSTSQVGASVVARHLHQTAIPSAEAVTSPAIVTGPVFASVSGIQTNEIIGSIGLFDLDTAVRDIIPINDTTPDVSPVFDAVIESVF